MSKRFIFSLTILSILLICAIFASMIAPFDPQYVDITHKLLAPEQSHLLGTDQLGRDVLSRLLYGARFSLFLAFLITVLEVTIGVTIGLIIGWYQGKVEQTFLWFANVISAFPSFLLSLATIGILGQGMSNMVIAVVIVEWVYYARLVINLVKSAKEESFVTASLTMGMPIIHVLKVHILPFIYKPILVVALMNIGNIILMISGFSFLGIGVQPNVSEWGMMLHDARPYFRTAVWTMMSPGLAIFLTVISFNLLGEHFDEKGWKQLWKN
ncbi:ABC transporter permease subunit [Granulicatella sp. zg-ZJ]|uniref:ABC transporter permease n=1 Tax=unclassified Granulicatella TaxID=2630493 RepID=UPI0013C1DFCC|nr:MULTISPECIES: ABC transporter permease [unclassified Granulicatella]MBS4749689.1 ABC transporter permease subunit [Carnobacteriaceae bacterium zg-ZUI78]NEW61818.1 ABC transporter permease subunit [Granulicatella sp. zg-ZJ]NEW65892.1 ABC transporter permease subunit [Granulicatella sp. zg-84]QMI85121.1 ABC transporter permease subunit [Carnobacteriaceae bacterium zg-84]